MNGCIESIEDIEVCEEVGRGGFGVVYRGINKKNNKEVAVKQIDLEHDQTDLFEVTKEIQIISECRLPQITRYYGCFVRHYKLWVIMEYVNGGSLFELLKPGPITDERVILIIMREVLIALQYLHNQGKIHRDLKSHNILLSQQGEVKLTDFGVSTQLSSNFSRRNTTVGTPYWMSPEVILNTCGGHNSKADIWSLGCCAYELFTGKPPLQSLLAPMKALRQISKCQTGKEFSQLIQLDELDMSSSFKDFLSKCFVVNPKERYSASKLLKHKFVTSSTKDEASNVKALKKLITNKYIWDQENYLLKSKHFYVPTDMLNDQKMWIGEEKAKDAISFDISLLHIDSNEQQKVNKSSDLSQKPLYDPISIRKSDTLNDKETNKQHNNVLEAINIYRQDSVYNTLKAELHKIVNKIFHKIDSKNSLNTQQYDLLVNLNDTILNLFSLLEYSETAEVVANKKIVICQYFKYFLKELMKQPNEALHDNPRIILQKLILPHTLNPTMGTLKKKDSILTSLGPSRAYNQFDEIESSLFDTWVEKMSESVHSS